MKLIDERGKLFGRINVIDLLLILIVLGALAFVGVKFLGKDNIPIIAADKKTTTVTLFANAVHPFVVDKIKVGDVLRLTSNSAVFGKIVDIRKDKATSVVSTADGKFVNSEIPDKYLLYIDIEGEATSSGGSLSIGGQTLLVGDSLSVKGANYTLKGLISDLK